MNLVFLFRRLVFAQVLLGIVAFCMAERNPGMLLVAGAIGALSWYVVEGPSGKPLPRWVINFGSVSAVGWLLFDLYWQKGDVILAMGHFTMWLQILLMYAEKNSRDYAQILVLSLLQMIGASVLSVSMMFGFLLAAYCILSLFTVLLFQIKITSDLVMENNRASAPKSAMVARPAPVFGRGWRWQFRGTALIVGAACAAIAASVFVLLPRTSRFQKGPDFSSSIAHKQTGFSPQVQLSGAPPAPGTREPVLSMTVKLHGANIGSEDRSFLLRGAACDTYDHLSHQWIRGRWVASRDTVIDSIPARGQHLTNTAHSAQAHFDAQITLTGNAPRTLFSLYPPVHISGTNLPSITFNADDQQMMASGGVNGPVIYTLRAPVHGSAEVFQGYQQVVSASARVSSTLGEQRLDNRRSEFGDESSYARGWPARDQEERLRRLANEIMQRAGLSRDPAKLHTPDDELIAFAICDYLRTNYRYSLTNPITRGLQEPILEFLNSNKQGHCELFAASMAALTRSIGMRARVITGFMATEFNKIGGYYVVRQDDAHAWTEVQLPDGWRTFDATPPVEVARVHRVERGWFSMVRDLYEHIEFIWIGTVMAYDKETRTQVIDSVQASIMESAEDPDTWLGMVVSWMRTARDWWQFDRMTYSFAGVIIIFIIVGLASLVHRYIVWRRRMDAMQLTRLPRHQRRELTRRLRFYIQMLDLLERHGYRRPEWQTPFAFAQEMAEANPMRFDPVVALTEVFYEIRFGHRDLDNDRRKHIRAHLRQLEENLAERRMF